VYCMIQGSYSSCLTRSLTIVYKQRDLLLRLLEDAKKKTGRPQEMLRTSTVVRANIMGNATISDCVVDAQSLILDTILSDAKGCVTQSYLVGGTVKDCGLHHAVMITSTMTDSHVTNSVIGGVGESPRVFKSALMPSRTRLLSCGRFRSARWGHPRLENQGQLCCEFFR
jgi:hypothetical protein